MTLFRTVEPVGEPVSLAEAKAQLRLSHSGDDAFLGGLIRAVREEVERATGMALINQTWRLVLDDIPSNGCVLIARYPVRQVLSVSVFGTEGEAAVVDPAGYEADTVSRPARLHFTKRPERLRTMNGIEIDFEAGFGEAGTDVPDLIKRAMLLLVAHWYEFRGSYGPDNQPVSYPAGYEGLISGYRRRRL